MSEPQNLETPEYVLSDNTLYLTGEITSEKTDDLIAFIISANSYNRKHPDDMCKSINLMINTHGGDMEATMSLISIMRASTIPINTIAIGVCASGGLMTAIAGNIRLVDQYCSVLSHTLSTGYPEYAKPADLQRWLEDVHVNKQKIVSLYMECTGLSEDYIKETLLPDNGDIYLNSEQAIKFKLFDNYFTSFNQIELE